MSDPFLAVREAVTALDAARYLGLEIDRHGRALCPWHPDHSPSLHFKGSRCHCFACGNGGDAIDLVQRLYGLSPIQAVERINQDFALGLDIGSPEQLEAAKKREEAHKLKARYEAWRKQSLDDITAALYIANHADWGNLSDAEALAVREQARMEQWCDTLLHGGDEEQHQLFKARKGVKTLTERILRTI